MSSNGDKKQVPGSSPSVVQKCCTAYQIFHIICFVWALVIMARCDQFAFLDIIGALFFAPLYLIYKILITQKCTWKGEIKPVWAAAEAAKLSAKAAALSGFGY